MNKYLARTLAAVVIVGPLLTGCNAYRNWVDPCWPQRYSNTARKSVVDAFAPQVQNGHYLDQTVWNYMFDTGTDELNGYGKYKLDYLVRRRPAPDGNIFLQTAHDVAYNAAEPDKMAEARRTLDQKRIAAIHKYLNAQTVGRPAQFDIAIHDPHPVGAVSGYAAGSQRMATTAASTGILGSISAGGADQSGGSINQGAAGSPAGAGGGAAGAPPGGTGGSAAPPR